MLRRTLLTNFLFIGLLTLNAPAFADDALDDTLALVGLRRADLGWTPKGWWPRFPVGEYKLRAFDALFAEPLDNVTYARGFAQTAWDKLDSEALDSMQDRNSTNLFQAVERLGVDPKYGGFRGYTANALAEETPLDEAILRLTEAAQRSTKINTFAMELPYPHPRETLAEMVKMLPEGVSPILGQLVLNIVDAQRWAELAFRKVDAADRAVLAARDDLTWEMIDAYDFCPQVQDVARTWDEAGMWNAGQKCVQALDFARIALKKLDLKDVPDFAFDWQSPWGWIRIRGGGNDTIAGDDALLIVDLGGDDVYTGGCAASTATRPIGLVLDMAGNERYESERPAQGAGICGVGILIDDAGDDVYRARRYAQGMGQFGFGLCADLDGKDDYFLEFGGQGCGYFGIGLLFDVAGNDQYKLYGDGQGLGGVSGVGVLADRTGNDRYEAVRQNSITKRPSYHSPNLDVCVSNAQGCGLGRRGDGADGHSWAGGLGALLDGDGNDYYTSGNWAMGTGYWFGIGILHDRAGNDEYHGVCYTQATGAHFCIGVLIDEAGDDKHLAEENQHSSLAWAHDFTISILLDAAGNDLYSTGVGGISYSINRSVSMLFDLDGNDVYKTDVERREKEKNGMQPGYAMNAEGFRARGGVGTYFADTTSLGLFLDVGGEDQYWGDLKNNEHWLDPPDAPNWTDRNFSVGVDRADGTVDFTPTPVRRPSGVRENSDR